MKALKCRECGREYPLTATHVCEFDFGRWRVSRPLVFKLASHHW